MIQAKHIDTIYQSCLESEQLEEDKLLLHITDLQSHSTHSQKETDRHTLSQTVN